MSFCVIGGTDFVKITEMFGYGVFVEDLGSWKSVFDFVLGWELLVGEKFLFESEEEIVGFCYNIVGEVVEARVVETGLRAEVWLTLKELHPLLCAIHAVRQIIK